MRKKIFVSFCMIIPLISLVSASINNLKNDKTDMKETAITIPGADTTKGSYSGNGKFLALGDSYTIGQSVHPEERFPAQTVQLLRDAGVAINDPEYIATTGWTTKNLMYAINSQYLKNDYDLVTLLIGVNDQYQRHDTAGYAERCEALLNKAIILANGRRGHVFVLSIPDYSVTPFCDASHKAFVHKQINLFNEINNQITLRYNVAYINITPLTREAGSDLSLLAFDELHPSGKEYKKWAEMLALSVKTILK